MIRIVKIKQKKKHQDKSKKIWRKKNRFSTKKLRNCR